jgi:hypothetical protein
MVPPQPPPWLLLLLQLLVVRRHISRRSAKVEAFGRGVANARPASDKIVGRAMNAFAKRNLEATARANKRASIDDAAVCKNVCLVSLIQVVTVL